MSHLLKVYQYSTVRLIYRMKSADHITDALACLHWLLVPERIDYEVAVLMYKFYTDVCRGIWDHSFLLPISRWNTNKSYRSKIDKTHLFNKRSITGLLSFILSADYS